MRGILRADPLKPIADGKGPCHETLLCAVTDVGKAVVHQRAHEIDDPFAQHLGGAGDRPACSRNTRL